MIHNMVGGGGQGEGPIEAGNVVVTYPSGATCTVTNGSDTYTALDTSGAAAFIVEPGTWTVKAVQGTDSDSKSVTVTAGGWVEVELSFVLWLYKNGDKRVETTGDWKGQGINFGGATNPTVPTITEHGAYTTVRMNGYGSGIYRTENKIDLTGYSTLIFAGDELENATSGAGYLRMTVWSSIGDNVEKNVSASANTTANGTLSTLSLDISNVSGAHYVGFGMYGFGSYVQIKISNLYLVPQEGYK